jgi:hypothetical protein
VPIQTNILSIKLSDHRLYLLDVLLLSVDAVAIVRCDRTVLRLAPVFFRSDIIVLLFDELSLFPIVVKSFGVFRAECVRI